MHSLRGVVKGLLGIRDDPSKARFSGVTILPEGRKFDGDDEDHFLTI